MGERKVLNKYYPPDFDPALLPRTKRPKDKTYVVRVMLPMTVCCTGCGEYIYQGKKFNARKETVKDEEYLGIKIFRFYIKCTRCSGQITFKTDPKNSDYTVEWGATRNFEPWKETEEEKEEREFQEQEEANDVMKALEARTESSKREMDVLDALEELRSLNSRRERVDTDDVLEKTAMKRKREDEKDVIGEEAEAELKKIKFGATNSSFVRRVDEEAEDARLQQLRSKTKPLALPKKKKKKKIGFLAVAEDSSAATAADDGDSTAGGGLCLGY